MSFVLEVENLRKKFGDLVAVDGISFSVKEGEIFGFLGPNGAGKTTTISMICGLLQPNDGEIRVEGLSIADNAREVKQHLGVVPQEVAVYAELSARENLRFWGGIYALKGKDLSERVEELLVQVGLEDRAKEPVKNFSGGMKRRLNLAMGLIHRPKLILLDEPTVGIDPQARHKILEIVEDITKSGQTVLYTTHYLEEAESFCDRLAIMDHGKILAEGSVEQLKAQVGEGTLLTVKGEFKESDLREIVSGLSGLQAVEIGDGHAMLLVPRESRGVAPALEGLYGAGLHLDDVLIKEPNLEDLFLRLTGRELRD
jgi:ABC-2 type transport system ATP-binding protein